MMYAMIVHSCAVNLKLCCVTEAWSVSNSLIMKEKDEHPENGKTTEKSILRNPQKFIEKNHKQHEP